MSAIAKEISAKPSAYDFLLYLQLKKSVDSVITSIWKEIFVLISAVLKKVTYVKYRCEKCTYCCPYTNINDWEGQKVSMLQLENNYTLWFF